MVGTRKGIWQEGAWEAPGAGRRCLLAGLGGLQEQGGGVQEPRRRLIASLCRCPRSPGRTHRLVMSVSQEPRRDSSPRGVGVPGVRYSRCTPGVLCGYILPGYIRLSTRIIACRIIVSSSVRAGRDPRSRPAVSSSSLFTSLSDSLPEVSPLLEVNAITRR